MIYPIYQISTPKVFSSLLLAMVKIGLQNQTIKETISQNDFKEVVKTHFNLNKDYGMYSFRHTFITKLYREMRKTSSQFETKSKLMLVTGHSTMTALENIYEILMQNYQRIIQTCFDKQFDNFLQNHSIFYYIYSSILNKCL